VLPGSNLRRTADAPQHCEVVDGKDDLYSYALRSQPPLRATTRVKLDQAQFNELWEADSGLASTDRTKRKHLHMAMAMLRIGTEAGMEISKFLQYWIGIAALDHQLKELEGANASKGWTVIFKKHWLDYAKFNEARNRLAHPASPGNFMNAYAFATNNMDALEPVLAETIGRLYGMSPGYMDRLMTRRAWDLMTNGACWGVELREYPRTSMRFRPSSLTTYMSQATPLPRLSTT
jgi:hypothetical protein